MGNEEEICDPVSWGAWASCLAFFLVYDVVLCLVSCADLLVDREDDAAAAARHRGKKTRVAGKRPPEAGADDGAADGAGV